MTRSKEREAIAARANHLAGQSPHLFILAVEAQEEAAAEERAACVELCRVRARLIQQWAKEAPSARDFKALEETARQMEVLAEMLTQRAT